MTFEGDFMSKKFKILSLILVLALICSAFAGCTKKDSSVEVKADDPSWHGNGMTPVDVPAPVEGEDPIPANDPSIEYSINCRFEGKMDENSFEVTEIGTDGETGEPVEGPVLQLRIGNDSVRQDVDSIEIGDSIVILCRYNEDSQLVAHRIMIL